MSRDEGYAQVRLPSGEIRRFHEDCCATIGQSATPNTKMWFSARRDARGIAASARSAVVWRATQWTIRMAAAKANPKAAAAGNSLYLVGFRGKGRAHPRQEEIFQPVYFGAARWPADETQVTILWVAQLKKVPYR